MHGSTVHYLTVTGGAGRAAHAAEQPAAAGS